MIKRLIIWIIGVWCFGMASAQSYHIGDVYIAPDGSKGVVYYLHPDGSGGWVVALNDVSTGCVWGDATDVSGLANQSSSEQLLLNDTAGFASTQLLRSYQNNNSYAAGVVDFAHGWVLPSPAQLSRLYARLPVISSALTSAGGTAPTTDLYWCSAEHSASNAWCVDFGSTSNYHLYSGQFYNTAKTTSCRVRAVRSFSYASESGLSYQWSTGATTSSITETPAQTTTYTVTVTAPDGSSGTAVQTVVVNSPEPQTFYDETCQGETYNNNGFTLTAAETSTPGVHIFTRTVEVDGCSTIHTLHLTVTPAYNVSDSRTVCPSALPYVWNGVTFNEAGTQSVTLNAANGCDSIMTLNLTVTPTPEATVTATSDTICAGDEVTLQAQTAPQNVSIGDIMCTDGTFVKYEDWPVPGKTAKGVVFYVDNTGEHGWAVHLQDQSTSGVAWGDYTYDIPSLQNYSYSRNVIYDLDGYSNTQIIRSTGDANTYPAAYLVDFDNGWYLPAIGQLRILFSNYSTVNYSIMAAGGTSFQTDNYDYLSSTENNAGLVWRLYGGGNLTLTGKNYTEVKIRSVRSF